MPAVNYSVMEENLKSKDMTSVDAPAVQWLTILLFLTASSMLFVWLFEWDRYQIIAGARAVDMSFADKSLLVWLLTAKSLAWFLPWLLIWGIFIVVGLRRTAIVLVTTLWIAMFYFMAGDLISVGFAGYHIWDYFPHIEDILNSPEQHIWQWAGENLTSEALMILSVFVVSGPACFFAARWVSRQLARRRKRLCSSRATAILTAGLILVVVGVVPGQQLFHDQILLARIDPILPFTPGLKRSFRQISERFITPLELGSATVMHADLVKVVHAKPSTSHLDLLMNDLRQDTKFPWSYPGIALGTSRKIRSAISSRDSEPVPLTGETAGFSNLPADRLRPVWPYNPFDRDISDWGFRFNPVLSEKPPNNIHESLVREDDALLAMRLAYDAASPAPADLSAFVSNHDLPNVILIIFESFRHSAVGPDLMKRLDAWTEQGLRLQRHYSGSNCSHLGLFSLFFGRSALGYHQTLDRKIPAQMLESLRRSGYKITFLTSGEVKGFRRLDHFISDKTCDEVILDGEFTLKGMSDWPDSDRRKLAQVRKIVNNPQSQPQFIFFYLVSSHYRYPFPPEFDIYKESPYTWQFLHPTRQMQNHLNRYANAALFLEDEVLKLTESIDPKRNLILITGDHGESMGEDGVFTHGSRMSEIQMRVPFAMVGPGVAPRKISAATVHTDVLPTLLHALAGKNVSINNCQGRDLISESSPADRVAVVPANGPEWQGLMVIREKSRMLFRTSTDVGEVPSIEFAGLADEAGQYELKLHRGQHASGAGR